MHDELRALEAGAAREQMRNRVEHAHLFRRVRDSSGALQEGERGLELRGLGSQRRFEHERRKPGRAPLGELGLREAGEIVPLERGEERMARVARLDQDFARPLAPAGAPGDSTANSRSGAR